MVLHHDFVFFWFSFLFKNSCKENPKTNQVKQQTHTLLLLKTVLTFVWLFIQNTIPLNTIPEVMIDEELLISRWDAGHLLQMSLTP